MEKLKNKTMKKVNNYWVDSNNNKWSCEIYAEYQAEKFSKTLTNCYNCINCSDCSDCSDCYNCINCSSCSSCRSCSDCSSCSSCSSCRSCSDCSSCRSCINCSDCSYCSYCSSCSSFKTNPQRITSKKMGSRNSQTTYYWNEEKDQIVCGCFTGTLSEFKEAVKGTHEDNEHSKEYSKWIASVEAYKNLNN